MLALAHWQPEPAHIFAFCKGSFESCCRCHTFAALQLHTGRHRTCTQGYILQLVHVLAVEYVHCGVVQWCCGSGVARLVAHSLALPDAEQRADITPHVRSTHWGTLIRSPFNFVQQVLLLVIQQGSSLLVATGILPLSSGLALRQPRDQCAPVDFRPLDRARIRELDCHPRCAAFLRQDPGQSLTVLLLFLRHLRGAKNAKKGSLDCSAAHAH